MEKSETDCKYNEDELYAPTWLNEEFLEMVINQHENSDSAKVEKYEILPGTAKGDHYGSVMFRAKVNYSIFSTSSVVHKYKSYIIKTMPEQKGIKQDLLQQFTLFETEIYMYSKMLPKMEEYLKSVGDNTQLCAKMIYGSLSPRQCIIFEDLVENGYSTISKRACTLDEVNAALSKLAKLQAVSYKFLNEGNTEIMKYKSFFSKETLDTVPFIKDGIEDFKSVISEYDELKMYLPYIEKVEANIKNEIASFFDLDAMQKRGGILVLNHGDFHMKNLMVKYEGDTFKDVMLVDYQICYYGPSVLDVLYAAILMFTPEMRKNNRIEIYSKYFNVFSETLQKLKMQDVAPTKSMFDAELQRYKRWEFYLTTIFFIFGYIFADGNLGLGEFLESSEVRKKYWKQEININDLRDQLQYLHSQGCFE